MIKGRINVYLKGSLGFVALLGIWGILSYFEIIDPIFLPSPTRVVNTLVSLFYKYNFTNDIAITTLRVLTGFSIAAACAVPLGICMSNWKYFDETLRPFISFFRYIPVSGFIPLLILWTGIGFTQKVWIIFLGVFFHLTLLVADDAARVPREIIDTARLLSAKQWQLASKVVFPYSLPAIFDDMRIMLGAAWSYIVVAELIAATSGIGNMMIDAQRFLLTDRVIAGLLTIGLIGLASDLLFRLIVWVFMPWTRVENGG